MKLKSIFVAAVLASTTFITSSIYAQAETCTPVNGLVTPAKSNKTFRHSKYKYSFKFPSNYKILDFEKIGKDRITIYDSKRFVETHCLIRIQAPREVPEGIDVYAEPINARNRDIVNIIKQQIREVEIIEITKVANQRAVRYESAFLDHRQYVAFLSPNRKYLIRVAAYFTFTQGRPTGIFNKPVFERVLATFSFV